jgi:hypothetical protein
MDSVTFWTQNIAIDLWSVELPNRQNSMSPAVGDVDGDGYDEIIVGFGTTTGDQARGVYVFSHDGQLEEGWPRDTSHAMRCSPTLGDLDNDGIDDIIISASSGVHAYLSGSPDWFRSGSIPHDLQGYVTPAIVDLENDGQPEVLVIVSAAYHCVYAWRGNGDPVIPENGNGLFFESPWNLSSYNGYTCLTTADLNNDGQNEVIIAGGSSLCVLDQAGNVLLGPGAYIPNQFSGIAIANVDEEDDLEIVSLCANPEPEDYFVLTAFKIDGTQAEAFPIVIEDLKKTEWLGGMPAIGDLDGDGGLEIIITAYTIGSTRMYGWHQDGTPMGQVNPDGLLVSYESPDTEIIRSWMLERGYSIREAIDRIKAGDYDELSSLLSTPEDDPVFILDPDGIFGSPTLVDIDGDDDIDIVVRVGNDFNSDYERIFAWDYNGNVLPGYPLYAADGPAVLNSDPFSPVIADTDKDGKLNIVLTTEGCKLISWELDVDYSAARSPWPKAKHDKWNSVRYGFVIDPCAGDANGDEEVNLADAVYLINYIFIYGPPPYPIESGDANGDGEVNLGDVLYIIAYVFNGGPPPPGGECP